MLDKTDTNLSSRRYLSNILSVLMVIEMSISASPRTPRSDSSACYFCTSVRSPRGVCGVQLSCLSGGAGAQVTALNYPRTVWGGSEGGSLSSPPLATRALVSSASAVRRQKRLSRLRLRRIRCCAHGCKLDHPLVSLSRKGQLLFIWRKSGLNSATGARPSPPPACFSTR